MYMYIYMYSQLFQSMWARTVHKVYQQLQADQQLTQPPSRLHYPAANPASFPGSTIQHFVLHCTKTLVWNEATATCINPSVAPRTVSVHANDKSHLERAPDERLVEAEQHLRHSLLTLLLVEVAQNLYSQDKRERRLVHVQCTYLDNT